MLQSIGSVEDNFRGLRRDIFQMHASEIAQKIRFFPALSAQSLIIE
jgi:hypothetical protein